MFAIKILFPFRANGQGSDTYITSGVSFTSVSVKQGNNIQSQSTAINGILGLTSEYGGLFIDNLAINGRCTFQYISNVIKSQNINNTINLAAICPSLGLKGYVNPYSESGPFISIGTQYLFVPFISDNVINLNSIRYYGGMGIKWDNGAIIELNITSAFIKSIGNNTNYGKNWFYGLTFDLPIVQNK